MIKLVAVDLDGTVVNESLQIAPRVREALNHLVTQTDVRVVIATGRMFYSALPFAEQIGIVDPLIAYQGAMVRQLNEARTLVSHTPIAMPLATELLERLLSQNFDVNLYMNDQMWTNPGNKHVEFYRRTSLIQPQYTDDLMASLTTAPTKLMVIDDERLDGLLEFLSEHYATRLSFCRSRSNFCEIIDFAASKWNALNGLAQQWGIQPDEIMAIGDQGNDLSMIEGAGIGVAMASAPDYVKAVANFVTTSIEEDGVANAIDRFVLGKQSVEA